MADPDSSPWSRHYSVGKSRPPRINGLSWMDPSFPSMDPRTFDIIEPDPEEIPQPTPPEIDDLYLSERQQTFRFYGLRTWEAAVLAHVHEYTAYAEAESITGEEIQVDESTWLPVWTRDRWMIDFTVPPSWANRYGPSHCWSAQDPVLWAELRKAIQLAENILRCTITEPWYVYRSAKCRNSLELLLVIV